MTAQLTQFEALLKTDPLAAEQKTLEMPGGWANHELTEYAEWVNEQTNPEIRTPSARVLSTSLMQENRFAEAMEWAQSIPKNSSSITSTYLIWSRADPEAALNWKESANLSKAQLDTINTFQKMSQ